MTTQTWQLFQGGRPISRPLLVDPDAFEPFTVGEPRALGHVSDVAHLRAAQL